MAITKQITCQDYPEHGVGQMRGYRLLASKLSTPLSAGPYLGYLAAAGSAAPQVRTPAQS